MKKVLLASTAIVGGALLAAPAAMAGNTVSGDNYTVSLGGIHRIEIAQYDHEASTGVGRGYGIKQPFSEVWVKANAKADNGIKYGVDIELEARGDASEAVDEIWAYISGDNWGRVELGNQDNAANRMMIQGHNALVGTGGYFGGLGLLQFTTGFGNVNALRRSDHFDVSMGGGGDATKMIYFTPRFAGFQLGASLTPDTGVLGRTVATDNTGTIQNLIALGANYVGKFSDVGVTIAGTYKSSGETDGAVAAGTTNTKNNDFEVWNVGAKVDFAGFTVAAGYQENNETQLSTAATALGADSGHTWNVGVGYKTGPWGVSAGYHYGERDLGSLVAGGPSLGDADIGVIALGAQYAVAPGWTAMAELGLYNVDNGNTAPGVAAAANDQQVFMITNQFVF
jgi:predicted porin